MFSKAQRKLETIKGKISKAKMAGDRRSLAEIASADADMTGSGAVLERLEGSLDERIADA